MPVNETSRRRGAGRIAARVLAVAGAAIRRRGAAGATGRQPAPGGIGRRGAVPVLALVSAVAISACGSSQSTGTAADPATAVPASAPLYVGALVTPEGSLKQNTVADAKALTHMKDPFGALVKALEGDGRFGHVNYDREVKPWLGPRIGIFSTSLEQASKGAESLGKSLSKASSTSKGISAQALLGEGAAGLLAGSPEGAMVLDTTDLSAARSFLSHLAHEQGAHEISYRGVHYQVNSQMQAEGIVGKLVVIGSEPAMRSVIDTHLGGPSLAGASSGPYAKLAAKAPSSSESILSVYLNAAATGRSGATGNGGNGGGAGALMGLLPGEPHQALISLVPEAHQLTLDADTLAGSANAESEAKTSTAAAAKLLTTLPGDSWLAAAIGQTQPRLAAYVKTLGGVLALAGGVLPQGLGGAQLGTLLAHLSAHSSALGRIFSGWAGPAGIFAAGSGLLNIQAGLVIESSSPARSRAAVSQLGAALTAAGASVRPATVAGAEAAIAVNAGLPITLDIAAGSNRFVIGLGPASAEAALSSSSELSSSPTYKSALSTLGGAKPALVLSFPNMIALLEGLGLSESQGLSTVIPSLRSLGTLAGGWQELGGGITRLHLVLGLHGG